MERKTAQNISTEPLSLIVCNETAYNCYVAEGKQEIRSKNPEDVFTKFYQVSPGDTRERRLLWKGITDSKCAVHLLFTNSLVIPPKKIIPSRDKPSPYAKGVRPPQPERKIIVFRDCVKDSNNKCSAVRLVVYSIVKFKDIHKKEFRDYPLDGSLQINVTSFP